MAVRVRVRLQLGSRTLEVVAIANTGFESRDAELIVPATIGKRLCATRARRPHLSFDAAGGRKIVVDRLGEGSVTVIVPDRECPPSPAILLSVAREHEVLMNDVLVEALGIDLVKPAHGLGRFRDDAADRERASEVRTSY